MKTKKIIFLQLLTLSAVYASSMASKEISGFMSTIFLVSAFGYLFLGADE